MTSDWKTDLFARHAALQWHDGIPRDAVTGDIYYKPDDAPGEIATVFLRGIGAPDLWRGRATTTIGETGFGMGLNFLFLWQLFRRTGTGRLHFVSVEGYPPSPADLARAHAAFPELADLSQALRAAWPPPVIGFHRRRFGPVCLTLMIGPVETMLAQLEAQVDAWFLDGFAPARNPAMWSPAVFDQIDRLSAPGAPAASFTVAAAVRQALRARGWQVEKAPGHGRKRDRLVAMKPGRTVPCRALPRIAIIGAGVAAQSVAAAAQAEGLTPLLIGAGQSASAVPAGVRAPRLTLGTGPAERLDLIAHCDAVARLQGCPLLLLEPDPARLAKLTALHAPLAERFQPVDAAAAQALAGVCVHTGGFLCAGAGLPPWQPPDAVADHAVSVTRMADGWRIRGHNSHYDADRVILAGGPEGLALAPDLPVQSRPGRIAFYDGAAGPRLPLAYGGYAVAAPQGLWLGSTFERTPADDPAGMLTSKLAAVAPALAKCLADRTPVRWWSGCRAVTPDRRPLAGPLANGLICLTGLGARGHQTAPLLAEAVIARLTDCPWPLERDMIAMLDPMRFAQGPRLHAGAGS